MIYFDNAATSFPKAPKVAEAVSQAILTIGNPNRGAYQQALTGSRLVYETREAVAELFHVPSPFQVAFTSNITESLNAVIEMFIAKEDHVITTTLEHNSVLRPLYKKQCELSFVSMNQWGNLNYEEFETHIKENTKAVVCTHASNVTGELVDIAYIAQLCQKHQLLFILDTAQTAGVIPIDFVNENIDILCFTGHKSLLGPQGTGGVIVREEIKHLLKPVKVGGSGVNSFDRQHPATMPDCFEAGTINAHSLAGLKEGIRYIQEMGIEQIRQRECHFAKLFYQGIRDVSGIKFYGDYEDSERCPIVTFNIGDLDSAVFSQELYEQYEIAVRAGAHCAPLVHESFGTKEQGMVRFSFSSFHTEEEIAIGIEAVREIAKLYQNG